MKKSDVTIHPSYYDTYISKVADIDLSDALRNSLDQLNALDFNTLQALGDQVYAPGKWTVRDCIQHLTDGERVFAYRALRFARNDQTALPGFDQDIFAAVSGANTRPLEQVLEEARLVRQSTIALFDTFDETALRRVGVMSGTELPVAAIGFIIVGHQQHHVNIFEERYFPLVGK